MRTQIQVALPACTALLGVGLRGKARNWPGRPIREFGREFGCREFGLPCRAAYGKVFPGSKNYFGQAPMRVGVYMLPSGGVRRRVHVGAMTAAVFGPRRLDAYSHDHTY